MKALGSTEKQARLSWNRAMTRTGNTLNKLSRQLMRDELQARSIKVVRPRLKSYKRKGDNRNLSSVKLWYGLNDLAVSALKGRMTRLGTKKEPKGAVFKPAASHLGLHEFTNGFIARIKKKRSIFIRTTADRYPVREATIPINDALHKKIDDEIYSQSADIFMKHFITDLRGRIRMAADRANRGRR